MMSLPKPLVLRRLLGATAMALIAQNAGAQEGFSIAINGAQIAGDDRVADQVRRTDLALREADVQVSFDGLNTTPRLALEVLGGSDDLAAGDVITLRSELNYPAFVVRGEVRVFDAVRGRTVLRTPIAPNGEINIAVPEGEDLVLLHRVYDAQGRYDETAPIAIARTDGAGEGGEPNAEEGDSQLVRQRIPVHGGAITVTGQNVAPGARVTALGERVATSGGGFVLQRILPAGDYGVDVRVQDAAQALAVEREITIPASEWFYVATVDLTYGVRRLDNGDWEGYDSGRLAFFAEGRRANGVEITASANTGEGDISDIFQRLDDRDPRTLFLRVDPNDLYPTYGDDSSIEDRTPTSGNLFLRIERDGNYLQWGDFDSALSSQGFVRNERSLYGLSGAWASDTQTAQGEPRVQVYGYAAQPDQLPQRDVLLGTGGSVYFLGQQDVTRSSETISIQTRDGNTGRVLSNRTLAAGLDYQINYIQGVITLAQPLQSRVDGGVIDSEDDDIVLVAQYEYTPALNDVDGYAFGGRVEGAATEQLRLGVSGLVEETGSADQQLVGVDATYRLSEGTFLRGEYAQSDGPGFGSTFSADGGLVFGTAPLAAGTGEALKFDAQVDLADLGWGTGTVALYLEDRGEGFSTLDTQATSATGDELFWGINATFAASETVQVRLVYDDYDTDVGQFDRTFTAEVTAQLSPQLALTAGAEVRDVLDADEDGNRTDLGLRLTYAVRDGTSIYGWVQGTVDSDGLDRNNRVGFGGATTLDNGWRLAAEVSDGTDGAGAQLYATKSDEEGNSRYAGWELDPDRSLSGIDLRGRDNGQFVVGGRDRVSNSVTIFGENTYDMFGRYRSLASAYGVTFAPNETWSTTVALEFGRIRDDFENDFDRGAVSVGVQYTTEAMQASGRFEYRDEDGLRTGSDIDSDTFIVTADMAYRIDEDQRLIFSADVARTETDDSAILDGDYSDLIFGYAYRPAEYARLNVLARYRYLMDEFGQRLDGVDDPGPRQRSHVASVDLSYNLNQNWTLGGKIGYRNTESAATENDPFVRNDAWLAVANARYHLVNNWDALFEVRRFDLISAGTSDVGVLAAGYRQVNENVSIGLGYNFGDFSDDLTDLVRDDEGVFVNLVANF